jgi:hypothetical protein
MTTDQVSETEQCGTSLMARRMSTFLGATLCWQREKWNKNLLSIRHVKRNSTRELNQIRFNVRALNHM